MAGRVRVRCSSYLFAIALLSASVASGAPVNGEAGEGDHGPGAHARVAEEAALAADENVLVGPANPRERPLDQGAALEEFGRGQVRLFDPAIENATAGELIGRTVLNIQGEELGRISDVVVDPRTNAVQAVVETGGLFGRIGLRRVAVPLARLRADGEHDVRIDSAITQPQLKQMASFNRQDYVSVEHDRTVADVAGLPSRAAGAEQDSQRNGD